MTQKICILATLIASGCATDYIPGGQCIPSAAVDADEPTAFGPPVLELLGSFPDSLTWTGGDPTPSSPPEQEWLSEAPAATVTPDWGSLGSVRTIPTADDCAAGAVIATGSGVLAVPAFGLEGVEVVIRLDVGPMDNTSYVSGLLVSTDVPASAITSAMAADGRAPAEIDSWSFLLTLGPETMLVQGTPQDDPTQATSVVARSSVITPPVLEGGRRRSDGSIVDL